MRESDPISFTAQPQRMAQTLGPGLKAQVLMNSLPAFDCAGDVGWAERRVIRSNNFTSFALPRAS